MAKQAQDSKKTRLNFELNDKIRQTLEDLKDQADASSYADVIRRALALYTLLHNEKQNGRRVGTLPPEGDNGTEREIVFL